MDEGKMFLSSTESHHRRCTTRRLCFDCGREPLLSFFRGTRHEHARNTAPACTTCHRLWNSQNWPVRGSVKDRGVLNHSGCCPAPVRR